MPEPATPLIERLRSPAQAFYEYAADGGAQLREAADRIEALEADRKVLREANADAFNHGYLLAISTMLHQHDEPVMAEDALRDSGLTWAGVKKLGLDDFDLKLLRPVFKDMERKDALAKTGGAS